jgi:hypothetical protein
MARSETPGTASGTTLQVLRIAALASVLALFWQFVTAGQIVSGNDLKGLHGAGAAALHVTTGVTVVAAFLHWRRTRSDVAVLVGAAVVFLLTFVQAGLGGTRVLEAHVPGALVVTVGVVWLAVWALRAAR